VSRANIDLRAKGREHQGAGLALAAFATVSLTLSLITFLSKNLQLTLNLHPSGNPFASMISLTMLVGFDGVFLDPSAFTPPGVRPTRVGFAGKSSS